MPNGLEKPIMIPAEWMESRGTLKLLDFAIPFTDIFKAGGVFVLDEFDAVIHPELIKGIIALFNDRSFNEKGAQLIFTTHNPIYMSNRIFRRDQIKFVERDKDTYESTIHSLADFGSEEVRNDENYLINYFRGKYSTLPYIDFKRLFNLPDNVQDPSAGRVPRKPGR
jgi:AAA15 family ATPase/GTPase